MADYKKTKMGHVPGDLSIHMKVAMLEGRVPVEVSPWQTISKKAAKSYKKDHVKKANRRMRRKSCEDG